MLENGRKLKYEDKKFMAALKGIDLDGPTENTESDEDRFERIKRQAHAKALGIDESYAEVLDLEGFSIIDEDGE